ncbi:MAG: L,D-transpeptidase family protein [Nitrincola lacisaponensis]|uniref:Glutamate synthase [NADPH] large chain n=1 Tax=Nitrincola lacisaponensis TaxID=267850 RepID=A0A063Y106_9GAMM|nr:L,D-transpeptidase [Nitrincola lacisaponensis]KDE39374.1 Glutamate synthase [NADPH] large chain [Nitrincola lacisaponensis]
MSLHIHISIAQQRLSLYDDERVLCSFSVSTASRGPGNQENSGCTPLGRHRIRAKIGAGLPQNAVLVGRRFTGEIYSPELALQHPQRDWILTRILWLCGEQPGYNRLGSVDSMRRYIYIHGTPDTEPMGEPRSHGCIRMRNSDITELFQQVPTGCRVLITAE